MSDLQTALAGESPPLVTPFHADGDVDHDALTAVVDHAVTGGVDGLFACGTTGEFASLTAAEQRSTIETVVDASGDTPVLAGVASTAMADVVERAEAAAAAGADAAVLTPPFFHTAEDPAGVEAFVQQVADRSPLPLVLYNIPGYVGTSFAVETVGALADRPDVIGIKDTSGELDYTLALDRATPPAFLVLQGYDTILLPSLRMGLDGGINALANVVPEVYATLMDEPGSDRARQAHDALADLFDVCLDVGFASGVKTALVHRGVIERDAVRPPLTPTPESEHERIASAVAAARDAI